ncbi:MAG TPA: hypothetical protein VGI06_06770, partial [Acidimicrobiales bacterium]
MATLAALAVVLMSGAGILSGIGIAAGPAAAAKRPEPHGLAGEVVPATVVPPVPAPRPPTDVNGIPVAPAAPAPPSGTLITHPGPGYWLVGADGGVFPFGRGAYEGGMAERSTNAPIVGAAVTSTGVGYWLVSSDGGVFAFGDARWKGSLPEDALSGRVHGARVVGVAPTPTGAGYWLASSDGGVFAFGDARYLGGLGGEALSSPIAAITATRTGHGYWLVGRDGAVYAYGDARYLGGVGSSHLQGPVVAMAATPTGAGYWLVSSDGGVYAFGDAPFLGGLSGRPHARIVGVAGVPQGGGYWLTGADGGVFAFGTAGYFGSVGGSRLNRGVVAIASGDGIAIPRAPAAPDSTSGFDISWPQCEGFHPAPPYGFGLVGVTDGHLYSANPCLQEQWGWATAYGSFAAVYVNTNAPTADEFAGFSLGAARACGPNTGCALDLWGRRGADQALRDAASISAPMWWLDVETGNEWLPDPAANAVVIRAMIDELQKAGKRVGIYSTSLQWGDIAGGYSPGLPLWVPGAPSSNPASYCSGQSFAGGTTWMAQSGDANFDTDVLCTAGLDSYARAFAPPVPLS